MLPADVQLAALLSTHPRFISHSQVRKSRGMLDVQEKVKVEKIPMSTGIIGLFFMQQNKGHNSDRK
jgi:hypothetical protein